MTEKKAPESNPIKRFRAKPTRSSAIKAMCANCMGCTDDSIEPGFRGTIRDCTSTKCPLWSFRPYQGKAKPGEVDDDLGLDDEDDAETWE